METKHTKGEWKVIHSESKDAWNVIGATIGCRYKIARCPYSKIDKTGYEILNKKESEAAEANAKLISSAPDLLDALQEVLKCERSVVAYGGRNTGRSQLQSVLQKAEKAIKKAIGE